MVRVFELISNVPLVIVNGPVVTFPVVEPMAVSVAVPEALFMITAPVVENPPIACVAVVPEIVYGVAAAVIAPLLMKFPCRVMRFVPGVKVARELMVKETLVLFPICLAAPIVTAPVPPMITPPVAMNGDGHSVVLVTLRAPVELY